MANVPDQILFSDINLFVGVFSHDELVYNADAINQNIFLICTTPIRTKWFKIRYGSNIPEYLFEPMDESTAGLIRTEINGLLTRNLETRVKITRVTVSPNYIDQVYVVRVEYEVAVLATQPFLFEFALNKQAA